MVSWFQKTCDSQTPISGIFLQMKLTSLHIHFSVRNSLQPLHTYLRSCQWWLCKIASSLSDPLNFWLVRVETEQQPLSSWLPAKVSVSTMLR